MSEPDFSPPTSSGDPRTGSSRPGGGGGRPATLPRSADDVVDELLGDELDWQRLVRRYPTSAVALAVAGGCWLGYRHGRAILSAVTGYMASEAAHRVNDFLGEKAL